MKWNQFIFNVNFEDCLQNGINNFMHESGYDIHEMPKTISPRQLKHKITRKTFITYLCQIGIVTIGLLLGYSFL